LVGLTVGKGHRIVVRQTGDRGSLALVGQDWAEAAGINQPNNQILRVRDRESQCHGDADIVAVAVEGGDWEA